MLVDVNLKEHVFFNVHFLFLNFLVSKWRTLEGCFAELPITEYLTVHF